MLISWFDATEAREFGIKLAHFYMDRIPVHSTSSKKSLEKQQKTFQKICQQMVMFKSIYKLNIYKKAQLGNQFKWTLIQAGYDPKFVDQFTKQVLLA